MRKKVFITFPLPEHILNRLKDHFDIIISLKNRTLYKTEILEFMKQEPYAIFCLLTDNIDEEIISSSTNLKIISTLSVGFNHIDVNAATKRNIAVCTVSDISSDSSAEFTMGLILSVMRKIPYADKFVRDGKFKGWRPYLLQGTDLKDKTLGIIGMGNIGKAVAERAVGFKMNVIYHSTHPQNLPYEFVSLNDCLQRADIVSLHVPLNDNTKNLIKTEQLRLMKNTAVLINTARGAVVNEQDLVSALTKKVIAGAGLDVYSDEPHIPKRLLKCDNVVLAPHIASSTFETRNKMSYMAAENIINIFYGNNPHCIINPSVLEQFKKQQTECLVNSNIGFGLKQLCTSKPDVKSAVCRNMLKSSSTTPYFYRKQSKSNSHFSTHCEDLQGRPTDFRSPVLYPGFRKTLMKKTFPIQYLNRLTRWR